MNDTTYDIGGGWWYPGQQSHTAIARTDTNGNLILEKNITESWYLLYRSIKTFDNKELFSEFFKDGNFRKANLHKFNYDLEYDSAYTGAFDYDYKCGNLPIVSDTINIDDCDVWTALPGEIEYRMAQYLIIYPNPAEHEITIKLPDATADENPWGPMTSRHYNFRYHKNSVLKIFDIYGKLLNEIPLKDIQDNEVKLDVAEYKTGIYLINFSKTRN